VPPHPEPFFLQADAGPLVQRFALHHAPPSDVRGLVVHVHAFAEEINKSRRMAALQSRALAAEGFAVLQIDLLGCGDSAGDFGDATWARWVADVVHGCAWLCQHHASASATTLPLWLWGHRAGALLAVQAAQQLARPCNLLLWQPATSGKAVLQQFLRLKLAGDMLGGQAKAAMAQLRAALAADQPVEVAGYTLHPALCSGLEQATLQPPAMAAGRVEWFELSLQHDAALPPAAANAAERWRQAGWALRTHVIDGPAFWHTAEIEDAPALLQATVAALDGPGGGAVGVAAPAEAAHP
jgi:exosortase A-associated hydrolase 2